MPQEVNTNKNNNKLLQIIVEKKIRSESAAVNTRNLKKMKKNG